VIADLDDLRARLEGLAARFAEKSPEAGRPFPVRPALREDYWQGVRDLLTRDVTSYGLQQMVRHDAEESLRFFARDVESSDLAGLPWWQRHPRFAWRLFLAMAFRLSPPRRLLFVIGLPLVAIGWLRYVVRVPSRGFFLGWPFRGWDDLLLIAASLLLALLVLELRDKLSLKGDLEVARQIQFGLVPGAPYTRDGLAIHALMRPANTVGGDYYDIIELGQGWVAVAVADVAGKGMPAALLMALLQGSLRTLLTAGHRGSDLMAKLNVHLCANIPPNRLVTFFYAELQPQEGLLRYVNAGHNAPFLLPEEGPLERFEATGMALGILPEASLVAVERRLGPRDRVFLYTDGLTEAFNMREEEYGEERVRSYLEQHRGRGHQELVDGLVRDALAFCGVARPRDDMTLMVLARELWPQRPSTPAAL
jgi:serine phosphatase RsbU (regulator of sigma subunit)